MGKLALSGTGMICLLLALESTVCAALSLPFTWVSLPPGTPWLALLFVLAVGFRLNREAGGLFGLIAGFLADSAAGNSVMIHPLAWFLMGWLTGLCGRRFLAHNLPSYLIFCGVGGLLECLVRAVSDTLCNAAPPSLPFLWQDTFPDLLLSLLFAPLIHLLVKGMYRKG
jgi:rod shape-determining protein MreD